MILAEISTILDFPLLFASSHPVILPYCLRKHISLSFKRYKDPKKYREETKTQSLLSIFRYFDRHKIRARRQRLIIISVSRVHTFYICIYHVFHVKIFACGNNSLFNYTRVKIYRRAEISLFPNRLCNVKSISLRYNALDNESARPLARGHVS